MTNLFCKKICAQQIYKQYQNLLKNNKIPDCDPLVTGNDFVIGIRLKH